MAVHRFFIGQVIDAITPGQCGFQFGLHIGVDGLFLAFGFNEVHRACGAHQKVG